jgi:hypothetical protein
MKYQKAKGHFFFLKRESEKREKIYGREGATLKIRHTTEGIKLV